MKRIEKIISKMKDNPKSITFRELEKVCGYYFGQYRQVGSHRIYKTPWKGEPWVNIQESKGAAKPYQVRQVLAAIEKLAARGKR